MLPKQQIANIIDLGQYKIGLNTKGDFDTLSVEESPDCMNVIFSRNSFLEKREGRTQSNDTVPGAGTALGNDDGANTSYLHTAQNNTTMGCNFTTGNTGMVIDTIVARVSMLPGTMLYTATLREESTSSLGTILATSASTAVASTLSNTWVSFALTTSYTLQPNTTYALSVTITDTGAGAGLRYSTSTVDSFWYNSTSGWNDYTSKEFLIYATGIPVDNTGYGLFDYGVAPGVRKLIGKFGNAVYKMDDLDGTWDSLLTDRSLSNMHCAQSRDKLIICSEDNKPVCWWDGTTATASTMNSAAPYCRYPIAWQGYLFLGHAGANNPRRFYYEDDTTLDTGAWTDYYTIRTSTADEFTGWGLLKNRLYAFMKNSIHRISYLGGSPLFDVNELITVTGAVPRTIKNIILPNGQEVLIFLNWQKQIVIFDGTQVQFISENVYTKGRESSFGLENINNGGLKDAHAVVDINRQWYILHFPLGPHATVTHSIVLDYKTMALFPFDNQTLHSSCYAEDSVGRKFLFGADYDGYAYWLLRGNTDNGTAVNDYYTSPKVGGAQVVGLKRPEKITLFFHPVANYEMKLEERLNFDRSWTTRSNDLYMYSPEDEFLGEDFILASSVLGSYKTHLSLTLNIPAVNNLYQYRVSSDSSTGRPWVLYKVEFVEKPVGIGAKYENTR